MRRIFIYFIYSIYFIDNSLIHAAMIVFVKDDRLTDSHRPIRNDMIHDHNNTSYQTPICRFVRKYK